jgi:hypothetical protein
VAVTPIPVRHVAVLKANAMSPVCPEPTLDRALARTRPM